MTRPIQLDKTYGVLHTENYFSFLGFAKKVGSDETQKIDVFLDNKLIDTIEANEFIQKIDDMYDVESKAFTYNLPEQYIGKKTISFKNHDSGEELLNSPYTLIEKNHEKFNEAKFLHSLSEPLSEELKNMYKPNCIGFLATKENLEDEDFVEYINKIIKDFPEYDFKALYFDKNSIKEIKERFKNSSLELLEIKDINDVFENLEVLISNYSRNKQEMILVNSIAKYSTELLPIGVNLNSDLTIKEQSKNLNTYYKEFFENIELFGFTKEDLQEYKNGFSELFYVASAKKYGVEIDFDLNANVKYQLEYLLKIGLKNHQFFKYLINLRIKLKELKSK